MRQRDLVAAVSREETHCLHGKVTFHFRLFFNSYFQLISSQPRHAKKVGSAVCDVGNLPNRGPQQHGTEASERL